MDLPAEQPHGQVAGSSRHRHRGRENAALPAHVGRPRPDRRNRRDRPAGPHGIRAAPSGGPAEAVPRGTRLRSLLRSLPLSRSLLCSRSRSLLLSRSLLCSLLRSLPRPRGSAASAGPGPGFPEEDLAMSHTDRPALTTPVYPWCSTHCYKCSTGERHRMEEPVRLEKISENIESNL